MRFFTLLRGSVMLVALAVIASGCTMFTDPDEFASGGGTNAQDTVTSDTLGNDAVGTDTHGPPIPPPTCDTQFVPCGGDAVGSWRFVQMCVDPRLFSPCPTASVGVTLEDVSGSLEITADHGYVMSTRASFSVHIEDPCSTAVDCSLMGCNYMPGMCMCDVPNAVTSEDTGTWEVNGNQLVISSATTGTFEIDYCVRGDWLELFDPGSGRQIFTR